MKEPNEAFAPEAPPGTPEADLSGPAKPEKSPLLREVRSLAVRASAWAAETISPARKSLCQE